MLQFWIYMLILFVLFVVFIYWITKQSTTNVEYDDLTKQWPLLYKNAEEEKADHNIFTRE